MRAAEEGEGVVVELCRPSDRRLTPAAARSAKRAASTELGLASSVISMSSAAGQCSRAASISAATVAGSISDGVPPPKKIEVSRGRQQPRLMREVGEQRVAPCVLVDARADMAVEVAIGAFGDAERPVDVERQRLAGQRAMSLKLHVAPQIRCGHDDSDALYALLRLARIAAAPMSAAAAHAEPELAGAGRPRRVLLRETVLDVHNEARARFGVPAMAWSDELAADALAYARNSWPHRPLRARPDAGPPQEVGRESVARPARRVFL